MPERPNFQKLLVLALVLVYGQARAQQPLILNQPNMTGDYQASGSIILTSGFSTTGPFRAFISSALSKPFAGAPSSNQNYISTKVFKVPNVRTDADLALPRIISDVNQTVQYFDGLGRPLQTVTTQGSPSGKDIVQPFAYDAYGREAIKYLPYAAQAGNGSYKADALTQQGNYYHGSNSWDAGVVKTLQAYSVTVFEPSPLNRVHEQGAPGAVWQPYNADITNSGHTQKIEYSSNTATEVKLWTVTSSGATSDYYQAGKLYKTISKDENWTSGKAGTTEEFKDLEGRVVLKRTWESDATSLSTYYVYDDLGNLRYVLPPAVNENGKSPISSFTEGDANFNNYIYGYRYDGRKRLTKKKIPGKGWEHLVYNQLDQVVLTQDSSQRNNSQWLYTKYDAFGRVTSSGIYTDGRSRSILQDTVNAETTLWERRNGVDYSNAAFPRKDTSPRLVNYYDDYDFAGASTLDYLPSSPNSLDKDKSKKIKSLLTGTLVYQTDGSNPKLSVIYYDEEGRVLQTMSQNHLGGTDRVTNKWTFAGELEASTRVHTVGGLATSIATRYEYDHMGRKLNSYESIKGQTEVQLSANSYNEIGQLIEKKLHNGMQSTSYAYNERGWLKNSSSNEFSQTLRYEEGSFPQFNGNIAGQYWGTKASPMANNFTYQYDKLNRLINGTSTGVAMSEAISYDEMGNITGLSRDNLPQSIYSYTGNRLNSIGSGSIATVGSYGYDANGNATTDGRNGASMTYNYLNLPQTVSKGSTSVTYTYNALGNKLKKQSSTNGITDYVNGIQYKDNGATIDFIQTEEGIAQNNGGSYTYQYNLNDHLGNVRYSFDVYNSSIRRLQSDDYYAFGLRKSGQPVSLNNKYLYNGKELQDELGQYDYSARFYDPVIGRWNVVDPSADEADQESDTPYGYVGNNPISRTDPDGKIWNFVIGATIGGGFEYAAQVVTNVVNNGGHLNKAAFTNVDGGKILLAAAAGAVGGGIGSGAAKLGAAAAKLVGSNVAKAALTESIAIAGDAAASVVGSKIQGKDITVGSVVADVSGGVVGRGVQSKVAEVAKSSPEGKRLAYVADRAERVGATRESRKLNIETTKKATENFGAGKAAVSGAVGANGTSTGVNAIIDANGKKKQ